MNKTSIPAFIESLTPDTANAKYSKARLKMYYVGETVDHRLFTKEFSDKLLSTIAYTPVVGFYSVGDEDFIGHNNVQHIYGIVPADANLEYVEDTEQNATFAVTDIILYTGRPDETGAIASKIIGKQHSLELDPNNVKYVINRDENGQFKNLEFIEGELIGLSVLGDNETPAFTGSEFFSAEELPEFVTEDNKSKYQALFTAMFNIPLTAEEVVTEIYRTMDSQNIYGYICEHVADDYAVIESEYKVFDRYKMSRNEVGQLVLTFECKVRNRFLSDAEIETLTASKNNNTGIFEDVAQTQNSEPLGTEAGSDPNTTASVNGEEDTGNGTNSAEELETLRVNYENLENTNAELNAQVLSLEQTKAELLEQISTAHRLFRENIIEFYSSSLDSQRIEELNEQTSSSSLEEVKNVFKAAAEEAAKEIIPEISFVDNLPSTYNENDEAAVVQKYKNKNRGKN